MEPKELQASKPLFGSIGLALVNTERFVGSDDRINVWLPLIYFNYNDRLYRSLTSVGTWLVRSDDRKFHLGLMAKARGGIDGTDTPYTGIADRDSSADAGLNLTWCIQRLTLGASWLADALGRSHGQTANLRLSLPIQLSERRTTTPSVGAEWMDQQLVDYYYGVTPAETVGAAPLYTGTATTNLCAGWSLTYFDLYRSFDGENWVPVTTNGMDNPYNIGLRTLVSTPQGCSSVRPIHLDRNICL